MNDNKLSPQELGVDSAPYRGPALVTTMADLSRTLAGLGQQPTAAERANQAARDIMAGAGTFPADVYEKIEEAVTRAAREADVAYVALMLKERHRITAAVYGPRQMQMWPVMGKTPAQVLADAREKMANVEWWKTDIHRASLRQAIAALESIVQEEDGQ